MGEVLQFKIVRKQAKRAYEAQRDTRHERQEDLLEQILDLPEDAQCHALLDTWPGKLPKRVKRQISTRLHAQWRKLRSDEVAAEEAAETKAWADMLGMPMDMEQFLELLPEDRILEAREAWGKQADDLLAVLGKSGPLKSLALTWLSQSFVMDTPGYDVKNDECLRDMLCLMLGSAGSLLLREQSRMKVQPKGLEWQGQWIDQERIYGFFCGHGHWEAQSAETMRECYGMDAQTGKALPADPFTAVGDARELVRRAGMAR